MAVVWLGLWQWLYLIVGKEVLVPSPLHTLQTLWQMMQESHFYLHIARTVLRVISGVTLSLLIAAITAAASFYSKWAAAFLRPAVTFMKTTPVMAIIILALLWFKSDEVPIFVCFLMCYPIIYTNLLTGLLHLDEQLAELSKVYKVKALPRFRNCTLPQLKPYLYTALDLGLGIGFKVVIAAEVLSIPKYAMGYQLLNAKIYLETQEVFAWVLVIAVLSQLGSLMVDRLFRVEALK